MSVGVGVCVWDVFVWVYEGKARKGGCLNFWDEEAGMLYWFIGILVAPTLSTKTRQILNKLF
jgi:hypothetical protein